ncbi:adenylosuccinate lyase [Dethiobacter alkaliphilus]|uniref:Adenylosuccinate lyase n=1 Tax=Dethiobacter alkaliphilus AHT 1 TaxID=555088 RepID=C0GHA3_DETAL|nr:adenylosuccinate lyase [Dethiobacter alkaliphilus]EEG77405.1 adenylosuccinate lyase [Dethiobacter alkaliphilus AHT 1]
MIERYTRPEMAAVWTLENKFKKWLELEIYACEAWAELGVIPKEAVEAIRQKATFSVDRILEIEASTRHDVVAFTRCVSESLGEESKYVHYGLTSSDVVDTALAALMKEAAEIILKDMKSLIAVLKEKAREHKYTLMMGRTHGVHAEPTTFGLKLALFVAEMERNLIRMERARDNIAFGKLSGAVGTYANIDPFVERYVCEKMGLTPAPVSTQILQRDRHAEYLTTLAIVAGTLDKLATEIRGLQKTETREAEEPFYQGQKGSSAMPHKRNPVSCEQITGLSRIMRGNALVSLENMPLWHERDISHSSAERVVVPDSTILINYMLNSMIRIIGDLRVYPENMKRNMERTLGLTFSQKVLLTLIEKGMKREAAYDLVQKYAMRAWEKQLPFQELLATDEHIVGTLTPQGLADCFDPTYHLRQVDDIFKKVGI